MDINQRKEQFSRAFIHAVASVAGFAIYQPEVDDDSVDMGLAARGGEKTTHRPRLELQIKCTHIDDGDENELPYDLKIKNYDDLRADTIVPRILVVVLVPEDLGSWISLSADQMCLHYCAYWMSLAGYSETANHETVRVRLSRLSNFSPSVLQAIMERINRGEMP